MDTKKADGDDAGRSADRAAVKAKIGESQAAARELVKDSALLASQARVLRERAARTRAEARRLRERQAFDALPEAARPPLTVSAACRLCGVCERTLRKVLLEPDLQARVLFRNILVGIFYRHTLLLPPDLVADLVARFDDKSERRPPE